MKAAAYARYSTDHQTENSIMYQLNKINEYSVENNIDIVAVYTDEKQSGTNTDRVGFQRLVAAARKHEFEAVIIYDITRGSRDVGDWFTFRKQMLMLGIQVISTSQKLGDITNSNDFIIELISVGMGQHEVLGNRQKSIDGVAEKAKQGVFLGGTPPLGYDICNGSYIINESESKVVRKIFEWYASGKSYNYIISQLKGVNGKKGRPLGKNSLYSILNNERYIGVYTWNKRKMKLLRKWAGGAPNPDCVRIENKIQPIIDMKIWERVQDRMSDNKRNATNKAKNVYLLSGLIECDCGASYVGHTCTNQKGYKNRYYTCGDKYRTHTCTAKNINADEVETFVVQHLHAYFLNVDFEEEAKKIADRVNSASRDCKKERLELNDIVKQINNGTKAILSGNDFPELRDEIARLRLRKAELEDIISVSKRNVPCIEARDIVNLFKSNLENWNDENLPEIIRQHITKIYAHIDGSYEVEIGVHIIGCGDRI